MGKIKDIVGQKFGKLLVLEFDRTEKKKSFWKCRCDCGIEPKNISKVPSNNGDYVYNGIDRIDSDVGYVLENCVPCCALCNKMKMAIPVNIFLKQISKIYNYLINK